MNPYTLSIPLERGGNLAALSRLEVDALLDASRGALYELFRRCTLAVLNCGNESDDTRSILAKHRDFRISLHRRNGGVELELDNPPEIAFVDGRMIRGIQEHLRAVLRDVLFVQTEIYESGRFDLDDPAQLTSAVFHILRNADVVHPGPGADLVVCWGGHSIARPEYEYTKLVGYQLGLRGVDICTGCGPGAMKGPMKGATIGHSKQRISSGRYLGITEPGIIAAESPNPIVRELVIMPDIEKRLEAFVRLAHAFVLFPGGAGSAEELLYLLAIALAPENAQTPLPLILTGPAESEAYFDDLDRFIAATLGPATRARYEIVLGDAEAAARHALTAIETVREHRRRNNDASYFHWKLRIPEPLQRPFEPTHAAMAALALDERAPPEALAADLRRAFSGIVAGNIKESGIRAVEEYGPFPLCGSPQVIDALRRLLDAFVSDGRMTLRDRYTPPYELRSSPSGACSAAG